MKKIINSINLRLIGVWIVIIIATDLVMLFQASN